MCQVVGCQWSIDAATYAKFVAQLEEDIGITFNVLALVDVLTALRPVDHWSSFQAQLQQALQQGFSHMLIHMPTAFNTGAIEENTAIRACRRQFGHLGHGLLLIDQAGGVADVSKPVGEVLRKMWYDIL